MSERMISFGAGPARWPDELIEQAAEGLRVRPKWGLSVLELSHRGADYTAIHGQTLERARALLGVPDSHEILLLAGGATMQFAMVPLNLRHRGQAASYLITGRWSEKAYDHAAASGATSVAASGSRDQFRRVPPVARWRVDPDAAYLHVTTNNTIVGTRVAELPSDLSVPLVGDASSEILARELPVERFGVLYAGAQKCLGPAGLALVVVRKDLLGRCPPEVPGHLRYAEHARAGSRYNTPPTALIWLMGLMLEWIERQGGRAEMFRRTRQRAERVYGVLEAHPDVFELHADRDCRSWTNVVFRLTEREQEAALIEKARREGLVGLAGHRSVGGLRASMYTGMPVSAAERLAQFLERVADEFGRRGS
ncbi:MAG: 3-phosphoserine/phosphohydroxythreonine transaminase [Acidobacteriota bacterium]|nr:MAG: 3-phosphoserine/phosphohydroxythreonine transaminase [Acidobacteriota bacterium]